MTHNTRVSEYTAWVNRWCDHHWGGVHGLCEHLVRCGRKDGHLWTIHSLAPIVYPLSLRPQLSTHTHTHTHSPPLPHPIYTHMSTPPRLPQTLSSWNDDIPTADPNEQGGHPVGIVTQTRIVFIATHPRCRGEARWSYTR